MFIKIDYNIIDIAEIAAITKFESIILRKKIYYAFEIILKNGRSIEISRNNDVELGRMLNELEEKLKIEKKPQVNTQKTVIKADCASCEYFALEGIEGVCSLVEEVIENPNPHCLAYKKNEDLNEND